MNNAFALELAEKVRLLGLSEDQQQQAVTDVVFWAMEQVTTAAPKSTDVHRFECWHCGVGNRVAAS